MSNINTSGEQKPVVCRQVPSGVPIEDVAPPICNRGPEPNLRAPNTTDLNWLTEDADRRDHNGAWCNCDPMTTGSILNDPSNPSDNTIYRDAKAFRSCDEGMKDMFSNIIIRDDDGEAFKVPIVFGTPERAVEVILGKNNRDDFTGIPEQITLPIMSLIPTGMERDMSRYTYHKALYHLNHLRSDGKPGFYVQEKNHPRDTVFGVAKGMPMNISYMLTAWTAFEEDLFEIVPQVILKFSPEAYIRIRGVSWMTEVSLDGITPKIDREIGDQKQRMIRIEFAMTARTYIPQPLTRKKSVLKISTELVDGANPETVLAELSNAVEGLNEC